MSSNVHSRQKDTTHIVKGNCTVLLPKQHTDYDFLNPVKYLFGIANTSLANASGRPTMRSGGTVVSCKVFNFGRDPLTNVMPNGMRAPLPMIDYHAITIAGRTVRTRAHTPEDTMGLVQLAANFSVPINNMVVIAQNYRLAAESAQDLRGLCRCMHFPSNVVAELERAPTFMTASDKGYWHTLDVVLLITLDCTLLEQHDNVLEAYSGVQLSRKGIFTAPAYLNDRTGEAIESPRFKESGIHYERSIVSNCVLVYHDVQYTHRFVHDCGVVVEVAQVLDTSRPAGFYKEWHHFDETGRLRVTRHFIERSRVNNANGFFVRSIEALNYTPKKEIDEIYSSISESLTQLTDHMRAALAAASKEVALKAEVHREEVIKILRENANKASANTQRMQEEIDRLRRENAKHEKDKDDLRHEMREARSYKKETSEVLKVVASSIGLIAVVLTQFKPKKKVT